ncbi:hypothetical protein HDR61_04695 [bacterium]|nr:hypothetical protein [bacterium]
MVFYYKFEERRREPKNWKKLISYVGKRKPTGNEIFDNLFAPKILVILDYVKKSKYFQKNELTKTALLDRIEYLLLNAKYNIAYQVTISDLNKKLKKASSKEEVESIKKQYKSTVIKIKKGEFFPSNSKWHFWGKSKSKTKEKLAPKIDVLQHSADNEHMDYIAGDTLLSILDLYRLCRKPFWHTEILEKFYLLYPIYENFEDSLRKHLNSCDTTEKKKELSKVLQNKLHEMFDGQIKYIYKESKESKQQLIKRLEQWYFQEYGKKIDRTFRWWEEKVLY